MKTRAFLLFLAATALAAQDKPALKDPFVKGKPQASGDKAKAEAPPPTPRNVSCLIETITLPQADYDAWLEAPGGAASLYEQALAAVNAGKAKLDGCHWAATKSGVRTTLEGVDELSHPVAWDAPRSTGFQYPTAYEMARLGDRLELECVVPHDGPVSVNHMFARDRFLGFRPCKADGMLPGVAGTEFYEQQCPATCHAMVGVPVLLSTLTGTEEAHITLVFGTIRTAEASPAAKTGAANARNVLMTARVISLDRAKGWELLKKHGQDGAAALAALKTMIRANEAVLEHVSTLVSESGSRTYHQSGRLVPVGVEYVPPQEQAAPRGGDGAGDAAIVSPAKAAGVTSMEERRLGFRWEVENIVNDEGTLVDTTLSFSNLRLSGTLNSKNWNERYPEVDVFSSQQIVTSLVQAVDSTSLVGTLNPPGETGVNERKDEGRMWLLFLHTSLE